MENPFIGRQSELKVLDRLWEQARSALLILYGRRRVGKTRLLTYWLQQRPGAGLYWMAEPTSALDQLRSFSQALVAFVDPETPPPAEFTYASWEYALRQASLLAQNKPFVLFIDEVTYLIEANPAFVGIMQKAWDHWLSNSNIFLVLSGSQMGLMQKQLLAYNAPLYGRATAQMKLPPLPFGATTQYFPRHSAQERIAAYAIWGGIPAYWERIDSEASILENLGYQLNPANNWLLDEPRLLLQDFVSDPYNYVAIMRSIAHGEHALGDIGKRAGLSASHTTSYLSILRDTGFVERRVPITERQLPDSRRGRYYVTDPYLRFYYRFLAAYHSKLAMGYQQQMLDSIWSQMGEFIQNNTWQEVCREWLLRASLIGEIPVAVEAVGSEWSRTSTVDVVGVDEANRSIVVGGCYWQGEPLGFGLIQEMVKRSQAVLAGDWGEYSVYYLGFSALGWGEGVKEQAERYVAMAGSGRGKTNYRPSGIRLLSLAEIDHDLARWA